MVTAQLLSISSKKCLRKLLMEFNVFLFFTRTIYDIMHVKKYNIWILFVYCFCGMFVCCFSLTPAYNRAKSHVLGTSSKNTSDDGLFAWGIPETEHLEPPSLSHLENLSCKKWQREFLQMIKQQFRFMNNLNFTFHLWNLCNNYSSSCFLLCFPSQPLAKGRSNCTAKFILIWPY